MNKGGGRVFQSQPGKGRASKGTAVKRQGKKENPWGRERVSPTSNEKKKIGPVLGRPEERGDG